MLDEGVLNKNSRVMFQTSATNLIEAFKEETDLCNELYGFKITELLNMEFHCFQGRKLTNEYDFVINDEVDTVGEELSKPLLEYKGKMLNLTGTLSTEKNEQDVSKRDLIESMAPVVYEYTLVQGQADKILTGFQTVILHHNLSGAPYKTLFKSGPVLGEAMYYAKCTEMVNKFRFTNRFMSQKYGLYATQLLKATPSKIPVVKNLLKKLEGQRGIVFATTLDYLSFVPVQRTDEHIQFNEGKIDVIGSAKKLTRGFTPKNVDFLILMSPTSKMTELEQLIGRVVRLEKREKLPTIYIFVTSNTYEESWLRRGTVSKSKGGPTFLDLNVVRHERVS